MKRLKNIGLWIAALMFVVSCSKQGVDDNLLPKDAVQIQLAIDGLSGDSRATAAAEEYVECLQMFVFPKSDDKSGKAERVIMLDAKKGTTDDMRSTWDRTTKTFTIRGLVGEKTIYVVANGTSNNGYDPAAFTVGSTTESELFMAATKRVGQIVAPTPNVGGLLMVGSATNNFTTNPRMQVDLVRQVAKIKLHVKFDKLFSDSYRVMKFGEKSISAATVTAYNVPTHSYITNGVHSPILPLDNILNDYNSNELSHVGGESDREWKSEIYVYENPQTGTTEADKKVATQFVIQIPYTDGTNSTVYANSYLVYVADAAATEVLSPHKIIRNNIYDVTVTVKGFGSAVPDVDRTLVTTNVLPWSAASSDEGVGDFITVDADVKTLKFDLPQEIKVEASDLTKVAISQLNNKLDYKYDNVTGVITLNVKTSDANSENITDIDQLTLTVGSQTKVVKINYVPSMAQRFAKGMLFWNGSQVVIGGPNDDARSNLLFKFGRPIAMKQVAGGAINIVYDPTPWTKVFHPTLGRIPNFTDTGFNPAVETGGIPDAAYCGVDKDYIAHLLADKGLTADKTAGDICRHISPYDGHNWRIPTAKEWEDLLAEGKKVLDKNGHPDHSATSDFGWFFGPNAAVQTDPNNPGKGSVFVYNLSYGTGVTPSYSEEGTLNIISSSVGTDGSMYYLTAASNGIGIGQQNTFMHSFGVRCIRDN